MFNATGGQIRSGTDAVELLGAFRTGVVATDGRALAPTGAPNTLLLRARGPGQATIDVVTGDPWHAPESVPLRITVRPAGSGAAE